ncbi:type 2 lanthipeptide synthetase LanM [Lactococcus lactis]|uniref:type 2 lanthipeptide synthetase LanM n=1 Tax=Lactococcus lactis TaxID=1358 RepID=UPI002415BDA5|nr:type 2 lanthipeptide synthetase LanM [Lactococcus lactis]MDG4973406.1 type 2 lanthipeptide synthetase LanM [Lactococcus lactis]
MNKEDYIKTLNHNAMTIEEKVEIYRKNPIEIGQDEVKKLIDKKNLVNKNEVKFICEYNGFNPQEFSFALSDNEELLNTKINPWLIKFNKILDNYDASELNFDEGQIIRGIAPFIQYTEEKLANFIKNLTEVSISEKALTSLILSYTTEIFNLVEKNIIVELNIYKEENGFNSKDPKLQFDEFMCKSFNDKNSYYVFYSKYAVSARLIIERTNYFINNITKMINRLVESKEEIRNKLSVDASILEDIELSMGDSHEQGSSVVVLKFNQTSKIVYKPKNLDVCSAFTDFTEWVNAKSNLYNLKNPAGVYHADYAFIEYISYEPCETGQEVARYYERFGYYIASGYMFSMTDIHFENIIANGEFPVIIDGETMFQNSIKFSNQEDVISKFQDEYYFNSILATALIPNVVKLEGELEISGLSGDEQKLSTPVLLPVDVGTSDFRYEKRDFKVEGSQNIPIYRGKKKQYKKYVHHIYNGFSKMLEFFLENKEEILSQTSPLHRFTNKTIRHLAKGTQSYSELLRFMNHPSCNVKMLDREKVLMNIWAYPHKVKNIIYSEYKDMITNDIPIFYSKTNSKSLWDSRGNEYADFFEQSGYEIVLNKINNLSRDKIDFQKELFLIHCGIYNQYKISEFQTEKYCFSNIDIDYLNEVEKIAKQIIELSIEDENDIIWPYLILQPDNSSIGMTGPDLYEGLSGIALFFLELYKITNTDHYLRVYNKCIDRCLNEYNKIPIVMNAFKQRLSLIYPLILEVNYLKISSERKERINNFISSSIEEIYSLLEVEDIDTERNIDWISGLSGVLAQVIFIYENYPTLNKESKDKLYQIIKNLSEEIENNLYKQELEIGQAHGLSGILLSLSLAYKYFPSSNLLSLIIEYTFKEKSIIKNDNVNSWCSGVSGVILSYLSIYENVGENEDILEYIFDLSEVLYQNLKDEVVLGDSLCHGKAGILLCLEGLISKGVDKTGRLQDIKKVIESNMIQGYMCRGEYNLLTLRKIENPTLFTGLSGIGYTWLKLAGASNHNVLCFS